MPARLGGSLATRHRVSLSGSQVQAGLVVLSHGLGTDQSCWQLIRPGLERRGAVLSFDLPGASPLLPKDFDPQRYAHLSAFADDLLALLDELEAERCVYIGHSVSGMIGALASIEAPERFERLVMINASPRYLNAPGYEGGFEQAQLSGLYQAIHDNYAAWVAGFAPLVAGSASNAAIDTFARGFLAMRPDVTAAITRAIFESDLRDILPAVSTPVDLIHSRHDVAVPAAVADYLHRRLPDARLHWLDADGHLPHLSHPDAMSRLLETIL